MEKIYVKQENGKFYTELNVSVADYVPAQENEMLAKFLDMGYDNIFEIRVQRLLKDEHPSHQVGVIIYITKNREKE